jgi:hypothetical protein
VTITGDLLYRRTQIAWPTVLALLATSMVVTWAFVIAQFTVGLGISIGVLALILALFATLTVSVTNEGVLASFGIGVIHKQVSFNDVVTFSRVRNSWIYGWGIHRYPGGVLYNASGLSAVEFALTDGRRVRIGTNEPGALADVVRRATGKAEAPHDPASARQWGPQHSVGVVVGVAALLFALSTLYVGFKPPVTALDDVALSVSNGLYHNTIPYSSMRSVSLEQTLPPIGLKTNGFAAGNTLRGSFNVDRWGNGRLYINRDQPPFIVIRMDANFLVVNFKEPERTRALYTDLTTRVNRSRA